MSGFLKSNRLTQSIAESFGSVVNQTKETFQQTKENLAHRTMNMNMNMNINMQNIAPEELRIGSHTVIVKEKIAEGEKPLCVTTTITI